MLSFLTSFLTIMLTAGLSTLGTLLALRQTTALTRETADAERKRHARYLAIRIVCVLDDFAIGCGEVVGDDGTEDQEGYRRARIERPKLLFPNDVDWKSLDVDLMYGLLSFPNEIGRVDRDIMWVADHISSPPDFDEVFDARIRGYAQLGLRAIDLMESLQKRYEISPRPEKGFSNRQYIEDSVRRASNGRDRSEHEALSPTVS